MFISLAWTVLFGLMAPWGQQEPASKEPPQKVEQAKPAPSGDDGEKKSAAAPSGDASKIAERVEKLSWLVGRWRIEAKDDFVEEWWTDGGGGVMFGINRTVTRGKLETFEFLRIVFEEDGGIVYQASPSGRFPPTEFRMTELGGKRVVFENQKHDFPTRIEYLVEGDVVTVTLSGPDRGKEKWTFKKWKRYEPK